MNRFLKFLILSAIAFSYGFASGAGNSSRSNAGADPYSTYIEKYSSMAVEQQQKHGIPASITLAQGLLESAAGRSTLATRGNNHFGIKCHNTWPGDTLLRDDDAANECFRAYPDALQSFDDHSLFLKKKRYERLFSLSPTDYKGWATGLKQCGYATDPNYASRLIAIIERYALYNFDLDTEVVAEETAGFIAQLLRTSHPVRRYRGLHYVIAAPGDTYSSIAAEFNLDPEKLRLYNDAEADGPIKDWEEVYLEMKKDTGPEDVSKATIGQDETIHSVAQRFGVKMEYILALNPKAKDKPGERLRLRQNK